MPPLSCLRCQQPLAVQSESGLCPVCAVETSQASATPAAEQPASSWVEDRAAAGISPAQAAELTRTALPEIEIATGGLARAPRLRPDPAGYELYEYIGGGGMGDVYLARESIPDRIVAIKFLRGGPHSVAADRFQTEIRALAQLDHPNIIRVISVDLERADPFFTMEYAAGGTLTEWVKAHGPLPAEEAARLGSVLARAVAAAHEKNILHRDLKPSNIVFTDKCQPKITDFGLAKRTDADDGFTLGSGPIGTPAYMPPEQYSSRFGSLGPTADVYGLGGTLFHMLTGRPPMQGTPEEFAARIGRVPPDRLRSIRPEIPLPLEAIVHKCLECEPQKRYAAAQELAADLERFLAGQVPAAPPLTRFRRTMQWSRRQRRRIAAGALGLLLAAGMVFAGFAMAPVPEFAKKRDPWDGLRNDWLNDKKAVLIDSTGGPKWHRWIIGAPEIGSSATGDGSCSFELTGFGMLELCPEPPTDRYRIQAKIRYMTSKFTGQAVVGTNSAGLYFGRAMLPAVRGEIVHPLFAVTFCDVPAPQAKTPRSMELRMALILQRANQDAYGPTVGLRSKVMKRAKQLPGPWRQIDIEIRPEGVKAWWDGEPKPFADLPTAALLGRFAETPKRLEKSIGMDHGVPAPVWSPRMPFGIWAHRVSIDVKDVVVTALE